MANVKQEKLVILGSFFKTEISKFTKFKDFTKNLSAKATVWNLNKFSATQVLREIKFTCSEILKIMLFDNFRDSEILFQ